ncbi:peptidase S8/S53 domain-containing protein [Mycena crocata]|nr:peptidase S8/S53 domain-containing protein [Mycena crocata]
MRVAGCVALALSLSVLAFPVRDGPNNGRRAVAKKPPPGTTKAPPVTTKAPPPTTSKALPPTPSKAPPVSSKPPISSAVASSKAPPVSSVIPPKPSSSPVYKSSSVAASSSSSAGSPSSSSKPASSASNAPSGSSSSLPVSSAPSSSGGSSVSSPSSSGSASVPSGSSGSSISAASSVSGLVSSASSVPSGASVSASSGSVSASASDSSAIPSDSASASASDASATPSGSASASASDSSAIASNSVSASASDSSAIPSSSDSASASSVSMSASSSSASAVSSVSCLPASSTLPAVASASAAPSAMPNGYIVSLKDRKQKPAHLQAVKQFIASSAHCSTIKSNVTSENGNSTIYSGTFSPDVLNFIQKQSVVDSISPNQQLSERRRRSMMSHSEFLRRALNKRDNNAPWGLARLAQQDILQPGTTGMGTTDTSRDWPFPIIDLSAQAATTPVYIYVLDLGVRADHTEFGGRVLKGTDFDGGSDTNDDDGHGTAVGACAAGSTVGVARFANIVPIKVASGRQFITADALVEGVYNALDNLDMKKMLEPSKKPVAVINMSIETLKNDALEKVFALAIKKGFHIVTGAGNRNADQCSIWANNVGQIIVGATDINDKRGLFPSKEEPGSNYGDCVDIYAPGTSIQTAGHNAADEYVTQHGTSFAAPMVAGIIASIIMQSGQNPSPADMKTAIINGAVTDKIVNLEPGSHNRIAQLPAALLASS